MIRGTMSGRRRFSRRTFSHHASGLELRKQSKYMQTCTICTIGTTCTICTMHKQKVPVSLKHMSNVGCLSCSTLQQLSARCEQKPYYVTPPRGGPTQGTYPTITWRARCFLVTTLQSSMPYQKHSSLVSTSGISFDGYSEQEGLRN